MQYTQKYLAKHLVGCTPKSVASNQFDAGAAVREIARRMRMLSARSKSRPAAQRQAPTLHDLIGLGLSTPVGFETCWFASLDPIKEIIHDVQVDGPVTVGPEDGRFLSGGHLRWSPKNICGLYPDGQNQRCWQQTVMQDGWELLGTRRRLCYWCDRANSVQMA